MAQPGWGRHVEHRPDRAAQEQRRGDFARFYFAGVHQNALYVQAVDNGGGKHPTSKVFDGSDWSDGPDLLPQGGYGYDTEHFDGQLLYLTRQSSPSSLLSFDGAEVTNTGQVFYNYSVDGDTLYGLGENGQLRKTTDLRRWTELETAAPEAARSIVVIDGVIYVGTTDSRIYRLSRPSSRHRVRRSLCLLQGQARDHRRHERQRRPQRHARSGCDRRPGRQRQAERPRWQRRDLRRRRQGHPEWRQGQRQALGETGKDTLKGGPGKDILKGGAGKDKQVQ